MFFLFLFFWYQLELTFGSIILANHRPNTCQYSGKTILIYDHKFSLYVFTIYFWMVLLMFYIIFKIHLSILFFFYNKFNPSCVIVLTSMAPYIPGARRSFLAGPYFAIEIGTTWRKWVASIIFCVTMFWYIFFFVCIPFPWEIPDVFLPLIILFTEIRYTQPFISNAHENLHFHTYIHCCSWNHSENS